MQNHRTIERIKNLIAVPSTADSLPALHAAIESLVPIIRVPEITIERFVHNGKPNLLAYRGEERPASFDVLLNAHVDVVPAPNELFIPIEKAGKLYGRGAQDMKGAAVVLAEVFADMVHAVPYSLGLQIVTDEETGGKAGTLHQLEQGVTTAFFIAGESTPLGSICNESKGMTWATVSFNGMSAHGAYPWKGKNAIQMATQFVNALSIALPTPKSAESWQTTANIATISTTNESFNKVPDQATVGVDIRYIPEDTRFTSQEETVRFLQNLAPDGTVAINQHEPAHYADPSDPHLIRLAKAVKEVVGHATFIRKQGSADIRFLSDRGIPAVVLGVGGEGQHSNEEYLDMDTIEPYRTILCAFLKEHKKQK